MNGVSLYIHIPFCISKCSYCDFFSKPANQTACSGTQIIPDSYIDALLRELEYRCIRFSYTQFSTVYIGGGTPSLLSPDQFSRLLDTVRNKCPTCAEITIECNPDDITKELLDNLYSAGVNRISVGIQCMDNNALRVLNRRADSAANRRALELLRTHWLAYGGVSFSADLISGLPKLPMDSFLSGLKEVMSSGADHISLYSLTVEESTPLAHQIDIGEVGYSDEENENQWLAGFELLENAGFYQYEVSNFAKPGRECTHNLTYWHTEPYIGIGAGACGTVHEVRYTNTCDIDTYMQTLADGETVEILDKNTQIFEFFMMAFRLRQGVSSRDFYSRFGEDASVYLTPFLQAEISARFGLTSVFDKSADEQRPCVRYVLSRRGMMFLNSFLAELYSSLFV